MLIYKNWLFVGIALLTFDFPPTSALICGDGYFAAIGLCFGKDWMCPDGSIFFNEQCYLISNNFCSTSELWIEDKCCAIDCLMSCQNGYCSHCCKKSASTGGPRGNPMAPTVGCPNQPVTPYPAVPVNSIPPITGCSNQPVTPYPVVPVPPTSGCPNEPVTPYPIVPVNPIPPTTNQPCCGQIPCHQTTCIQNCVQNCQQPCSQPCAQCCGSTNGCYSRNICNQETFYPKCCQSSCSTNCFSTPQPPITPQEPTTPQTPSQPPTLPPINPPFTPLPSTTSTIPSTITTTLPPDPIIACPPGTKPIGNSCHLIYCPRGSIMRANRCIAIECPEGTVWTGYRCSMPESIEQNLTFNNTIITNFNHSKPEIILNNTNSIVVDASIALLEKPSDYDCYPDGNDCDPTPSPPMPIPSTTTKPVKCCEVMTPRICKQRNNRWHCYSRRYRRCGDFCVAPIIYLRPPRVQVRPKCVVMPPLQQDCNLYGNCGQLTGGYDCSGCGMGSMENCSYYCYRYFCPSQQCGFYDQEEYCSHYAGSYGCQEEDGCYDDWCQ